MIHFDEMACLLYLEGQLDQARASELAAHADQCAPCRDLLRALELESQLLTGALTEENESMPARLLGSKPRTWPSWVWTLTFGTLAAAAYWVWVDGVGPWFDQLSNAGFGGTDLMSMVLFTGAFWEGWGDLVDMIQIVVLVVVVVAALSLVRRRMRRSTAMAIVIPTLLFALALPQSAGAAEVRRGRVVAIAAGETVHNDLIVTGQSVRMDGTVDGDLIVFTRDLTVTGHVTGDVIAFTGMALIDGTVDGNVRVFSQNVTLQGVVGKNVSALARSVTSTPKASVGGGMIAIAAEIDLDGKIKRDLFGIIGSSELDGLIGGAVWLRGATLAVASTAEIDGPAIFLGQKQPEVASGAKLASPIQVEITQEVRRTRRTQGFLMVHAVLRYAAALLTGIFLITVLPGFFRAALREAGSIGLPVGVGAVALIVGVMVLVFGVLLLFIGVGAGAAAAAVYAPVLYLAQVIVGAWLGNRILGQPGSNPGALSSAMIGHMALGILILHLAGLIPVLGALLWAVVLLWGTGAVLLGFYRVSRMDGAAQPA